MAENMTQPKTDARTPEIPWMRRWEKRAPSEAKSAEEKGASILSDIEFMSMLEELEYR